MNKLIPKCQRGRVAPRPQDWQLVYQDPKYGDYYIDSSKNWHWGATPGSEQESNYHNYRESHGEAYIPDAARRALEHAETRRSTIQRNPTTSNRGSSDSASSSGNGRSNSGSVGSDLKNRAAYTEVWNTYAPIEGSRKANYNIVDLLRNGVIIEPSSKKELDSPEMQDAWLRVAGRMYKTDNGQFVRDEDGNFIKKAECLKQSANESTRLNSLLDPNSLYLRDLYSKANWVNHNIPDNKDKDGQSWASWEIIPGIQEQGDAYVIPLNENVNFDNLPVNTIYLAGNADGKYITEAGHTDEYGRPWPSHTYYGEAITPTSNIAGDYGSLIDLSTGGSRLYQGNEKAKWAIIPKYDRNGQLIKYPTNGQLRQEYLNYKNNLENASIDNLIPKNGEGRSYLERVDPKTLVNIATKYNMPLEDTFKWLMAIGQQESKLGGLDSKMLPKHLAGPLNKTGLKILRNVGDALDHTFDKYDTKTAWQHESDIYDELKAAGTLEGLSPDQARALINQEYNNRKAIAEAQGINKYGEIEGHESLTNHSEGLFQQKYDPYLEEIHKQLQNTPTSIGDKIQRAVTGASPEQITQAYNLFGHNYALAREKYPDLTPEQLARLAVVMHNAPSKANNPEFVKHYITNEDGVLLDSYLNKVTQHRNNLYRDGGSFSKLRNLIKDGICN